MDGGISFATILYYLAIPAMLAVAVVLMIGLFSMMRGDSSLKQNKMMMLRVKLQALAVALMIGAVYLLGRS